MGLFCFQHSQLGLEFFDSYFKIKQHPYTLEDHLQYVARLSLGDPVAPTSEDSESPVASTSKDLDTTIVPPSVIDHLDKCLKKSDETNAGLKGVFFHCASKGFKTKTVS